MEDTSLEEIINQLLEMNPKYEAYRTNEGWSIVAKESPLRALHGHIEVPELKRGHAMGQLSGELMQLSGGILSVPTSFIRHFPYGAPVSIKGRFSS